MLTQTPLNSAFANRTEKGCKLVNGTRLYYEKKGEGQPLVFIHGFTLDSRMWEQQFHYFSKWFCCIRYDLRGFGQSALPGNDPYALQEDLRSLLFSLDICEPVILMGLSMGGRVATDFALQFPRFTKAIILADTQIERVASPESEFEGIFTCARRKGIDFAKRRWLSLDLFSHAKKNKAVAESLERMVHAYSGWHFVDENPITKLQHPAMKQLLEIQVPLLVINGEFDVFDFKTGAAIEAEQLPGLSKVVVPDAGHFSNMESPEFFNRSIQQFLGILNN